MQDQNSALNSCVFLRNYLVSVEKLSSIEDRGILFSGILHFLLDGVSPDLKPEAAAAVFQALFPVLKTGRQKAVAGRYGGLTGGSSKARTGNQNASKTQAKRKETQAKRNKEEEELININAQSDDCSAVADGCVYEFEEFWETYGKKLDRKKCETRFSRLSKADREKIRAALPAYVARTPDPQYRKNPLTWLNGECWNDEPLSSPAPAPAEQLPLDDPTEIYG